MEQLTFIELFIAICLISFAYWWYNYYKTPLNQYLNKFTGPTPNLIFGNALELTSTTKLLKIFTEYTTNHGGIAKIQIGPFRKMILVSNYKYLEFLLSSQKILSKSRDYAFLWPWLGTGLLTSSGMKWRKHRKIITPAFHFKVLEKFIDVFESAGEIMRKKLSKKVGENSVDIYPFVTLCALDIICESAMGASVNAQNNENSDYVRSVKDMCRIIIKRSMSPLEMYDVFFKYTENYRTQCKALNILHKYTNDVIDKKRNELKNKRQTSDIGNNDDDFGIKEKPVFLDLLLQATVDGRPLTQEEIREEVDTFMFEGHDTTASAMSFTLYCLATNPDVQQKALEEQQQLFGLEKNPVVTYANLQEMKYLDMVIKETLRLYPSVPFYARENVEEVEQDDGTIIPKGLSISIFAYGIHRNPEYFPEPEKFIPTRFENVDGTLPYAYIPFSAGSRNCIGQKFAILEMKSIISKVLRNFELLPANPQHTLELAAETVLKSANGIKISLQHRK